MSCKQAQGKTETKIDLWQEVYHKVANCGSPKPVKGDKGASFQWNIFLRVLNLGEEIGTQDETGEQHFTIK